jgi:polysaccharide pyruvyl transferase WcaK-like protein
MRFKKWEQFCDLIKYLKSDRHSGIYSGFVGENNLGDEILWQSIKEVFLPLNLVNVPKSANQLINQLMQSQLKFHKFVILGGGTLIGANLPNGHNPFRDKFAEVQKRVKFSFVFGTGVGKLSLVDDENNWLKEWQPILSNCQYVGVRGPHSLNSLTSINIKAEILGDPACLMTQKLGFWQPDQKKLGINVGYSLGGKKRPAEQIRFIQLITEFVKEQSNKGWTIEFFVVAPQDIQVTEQVIRDAQLSNYKVNCIFEDAIPYLMMVRKMNIFIGMKLHSSILAMCAGVPTIMIEYAPKCLDFMTSVDMADFNINIQDVTREKLNQLMINLLSYSESISNKVNSKMLQLKKKQTGKSQELQVLLSDNGSI